MEQTANLTFHTKALLLCPALFFCSLVVFSTDALSLFLSRSFDAKNTQNERGEREGKMWEKEEKARKRKTETKNLYLSDLEEAAWNFFLSRVTSTRFLSSLKQSKPSDS